MLHWLLLFNCSHSMGEYADNKKSPFSSVPWCQQVICRCTWLRILSNRKLTRKSKHLYQRAGHDLDLLQAMHAEGLSRTIHVPVSSLVLIVQTVFLSEREQIDRQTVTETDRQTDATHRPIPTPHCRRCE